jgi:hypothetical protein
VKEKKREKIKNAIKIGLHYKFYDPAVDGGRREEFLRPMLKSVRKEGARCQATVSDRGDRGSFYNFEHPAF